jgi:hypothetical protein
MIYVLGIVVAILISTKFVEVISATAKARKAAKKLLIEKKIKIKSDDTWDSKAEK